MPVDDALAARKSDVGQNLRSHLQTRITAGLNHGADVISILFANNRRGPPLRHGVCATTARQTNLSSLYLAMITSRSILALLWVAVVVEGFAPRIVPPRRSATAMHCICVDCAHVTNCAAYHFVETKHEQPHMNEKPTLEPVDGR